MAATFFKFSCNLAVIIFFIFINEAFAWQPIASKQTTIYYDYLPFVEASKTRQAQSAVAAANLLLLRNISKKVDVQFRPTMRLLAELEEETEKSVCSLFKLKTDKRSESFDFSLPISFLSTNRLYLQKSMPPLDPALLNDEGELKTLSSLFTDNNKIIMLWDLVSYGNIIDEAINNIPSKNKIIIQGLTSHDSLAKMIERGRTDYAIIFPSEIAAFKSNTQAFDLLSYRIAGVKPISTGHLMCNKNEVSKAFLQEVNDTLIALYKTPAFIEANTLNVSPEEAAVVIEEIKKVASDISTSR